MKTSFQGGMLCGLQQLSFIDPTWVPPRSERAFYEKKGLTGMFSLELKNMGFSFFSLRA